MKLAAPNIASASPGAVTRRPDLQPRTLESEKARLRKATQEFESLFNYYMLKSMRKTVPMNEESQSLPLGGNQKDTYTDMFDMEVARLTATSDGKSLSHVLYKSLEKLIDAQFGQKPTDNPGPREPIPLREHNKSLPEPSALRREPIQLKKEIVPAKPVPTAQMSASQSTLRLDPALLSFRQAIESAATEHKVDSALIASVITVESSGNPTAVSPAGAKGLMQLMDTTATEQGVADVFDPHENIHGGTRVLSGLLDRFGDVRLALAAYNSGPAAVRKYDGIPPYKETRQFVDRVMSHWNRMRDHATGPRGVKEP